MGPTIVLDKSTFQSLSWREHFELDTHFMENLTPILGMELLGDLAKAGRGTRTAEDIVADLSRKFGGSGPTANADYRQLCLAALLGHSVPLDGRIAPQNMTIVPDGNRGYGALIEPAPINEAIMRWSAGHFEDFERQIAEYWRLVTRKFDQDDFERQLEKHHVILPVGTSERELVRKSDYLLEKTSLQSVWLDWMLEQLALGEENERVIRSRWSASRRLGFGRFAPYAAYCLRVHFILLVLTRNGFIRWLPTNLLDVQYLYYAPFAQVFSSNDTLHRILAPHVLRDDQMFIPGVDLKGDLLRLVERFDSLSEEDAEGERFAFGSYPPPSTDSVIYQAWKRYMRPWDPTMVNLATTLDQRAQAEAILRIQGLFSAAHRT